jgi:hypothetical protein
VTEISIELPDDLAGRLEKAAAERGMAAEQLALELLDASVPASRPRERFGFVGMGDSGSGGGDIGRRHREVIREEYSKKTASDV